MFLSSYNREKIGELFRKTRKEFGWKQEDVAEKTGLSVSTVSNIELGNHRVKEENLISYAEVIGVAKDVFGIQTKAEATIEELKQKLFDIELIIAAEPEIACSKLDELNEINALENSNQLKPYAHYLWGRCYFEKRKWKQAEKHLKEAIRLIEMYGENDRALKMSNILAGCLNDLARIAFYQNDFQKGLHLVERGLLHFMENGERLYYSYFLQFNRCVYLEKLNRGNPAQQEEVIVSLENLKKGINAFEKTEEMLQHVRLSIIIQYYDMFATAWNTLSMTDKALEYAQKGINIAWINLDYDRLLTLWNITGTIFLNKQDPVCAEKYFLQALDLQSKLKREYLLIPTFMNLGMLYLQLDEPTTAQQYLKKALRLTKRHGDIPNQIKVLQFLGQAALQRKTLDEARDQLLLAQQISEEHELVHLQLELIDDLITCYRHQQQTEKSLLFAEKAYLIRQAIKSTEGARKYDSFI